MWNEKELHWLDTGYNVWLWPHDLDPGCFKVKFSISGIVGLIDVKWRGSGLIWYWANCMTLPFDHTHDLDLGVSRSESEIALYQEWGGWLTWHEKDVSRPCMTMTNVTMVGWADVPDSDRGDFRRRCALYISSFRDAMWIRFLTLCDLVMPSGDIDIDLIAPSHNLKQCWLISEILWHLPDNFTGSAQDINWLMSNMFEITGTSHWGVFCFLVRLFVGLCYCKCIWCTLMEWNKRQHIFCM